MSIEKLLICPIRGNLNIGSLAKDGLTINEEARRIAFLKFLLNRSYPKENIAIETVVIKNIGESGRNKVRADVIVYDENISHIKGLSKDEQLKKALLVAEIKRDSSKQNSGVACQLLPAMHQLPSLNAMGVYWDDINKSLFIKKLIKGLDANDYVEIIEDSLENLPKFGLKYKTKALKYEDLSPPTNLVATLYHVANIMRSHGVNDEHIRYKETVKLILARYCDERKAQDSKKNLSLQVLQGNDIEFKNRVDEIYDISAKRYKQAKTLFKPAGSELEERTLKEIIKAVQGISFVQASNEIMQQVFLSFVPAVFKKNLDQFFTPLTLINSMVNFVKIGPNDKVCDPAMGTADFLTSAMEYRTNQGDHDAHQRIFGMDIDEKAFDLAVINMILNKDGQSNLKHIDSIANYNVWQEEMDIALCNPPFGEKSLENRSTVLQQYDLGHQWKFSDKLLKWEKTENLMLSQQLGLLFIERCYKLLADEGRMAIILPEGYLCTNSYGYVRQWIVDHFRIIGLVELPRRIFLKSNADLRSNILILQKLSPKKLSVLVNNDYPIFTGLVRKVGYKLGSGFAPIPKQDNQSGDIVRDTDNNIILDSDFNFLNESFKKFTTYCKWNLEIADQPVTFEDYQGGKISDILFHKDLDMKPRRLMPNALINKRQIQASKHIRLGDIAEVVDVTIDLTEPENQKIWQLVEGMDIRANEGIVIPQHPCPAWQIVNKKGKHQYQLQKNDIAIGLVRPERRNIGLVIHNEPNMVCTPDGIALVRVKSKFEKLYPQLWLFSQLRSERTRLQLWTESGGTSYGKLNTGHIENVLIESPSQIDINKVAAITEEWSKSLSLAFKAWAQIGTEQDRRPIINSAIIGLDSSQYIDDEEDI